MVGESTRTGISRFGLAKVAGRTDSQIPGALVQFPTLLSSPAMPTDTIVIFASVDGQTMKICHHIKNILMQHDHLVAIHHINDVPVDMSGFDKVIIASSIRYGKHNTEIEGFIHQHTVMLNSKRTAFISVNLVARKKEKSSPDTNPYVVKFLGSIGWHPTLTAVFAGKLNYKQYGFSDRLMIKLIMLLTKGPTHSSAEIEYTDWKAVDQFAKELTVI